MFHNNNMKRMFNYFEILFIVILLIMGTKKYYSEKSILAFNNESYYIENYSIVDKNIFKESFINYLYKNNDEEKYLSKIYDYNTKEELKITDLIKKECIYILVKLKKVILDILRVQLSLLEELEKCHSFLVERKIRIYAISL